MSPAKTRKITISDSHLSIVQVMVIITILIHINGMRVEILHAYDIRVFGMKDEDG